MPGRRPLLPFVALSALALPACLDVNAHVAPKPVTPPERATAVAARAGAEATKPQPPRAEFAVLPKAPGTVVATNPTAPVTANAAPKPADAPPAVKPAGGEPAPFPAFPQIGPPAEAPLLAAVRAYSENRLDQAFAIINKMQPNQQDFVLAVLPILARGASADLVNDPATAAALVDQLRSAATRFEPLAALKIEKVVFCNRVDSFGRFVPRPIAEPFKPNGRVPVYLELRNLGSQPTGDGFLTHVRAAVEVRDANDRPVAQTDPDDHRRVPVVRFENRLVTRSPLQDFYMLYEFAAPAIPGVYTVTVQLSDAAGRRTVTSAPAEFRVAGP